MAPRQVSFYGQNQGGPLGGTVAARDYRIDPRRQIGQNLLRNGSSMAPVQSTTEGIARALQGAAGGYFAGQARDELKAKEAQTAQDMSAVLAGGNAQPWVDPDTGAVAPNQNPTGGFGGMAEALKGMDNPDMVAFAQKVAMGQMQERQAIAQAEAARATKIADRDEGREYDEKVADFDQARKMALKSAPGGANSPTGRPASPIQNFAERQRLVKVYGDGSPEVRRFDDYVRANKVVDTGSSLVVHNPSDPANPTTVAPKTLKPGEKPGVKEALAAAVVEGKALGEARVSLADAQASMPKLMSSVETLSELGKKATYSLGGQAVDFAVNQAGYDTEGATARVKYISNVKNNILPLLRQTFGAAFTAAEGDSLLVTMGDPDKTSVQKDAALDSFIKNKMMDLETKKRRVSAAEGKAVNRSAEDEALLNRYAPKN